MPHAHAGLAHCGSKTALTSVQESVSEEEVPWLRAVLRAGEGNPLEEWVRRVVDFGVFFCTSSPFIEPVGVRVKDMSPDTFWGRKAAEQSGMYADWVAEALLAGGAAAERARAWVAADEAARGGGGGR